jgi:hypothetical protein
MSNDYSLVVSFPDQSETFVLGVEAGIIWNRLENGESFGATVHVANQEVLRRMANAMNLDAQFREVDIVGWCDVTFLPRRPRLRLVKGGLGTTTAGGAGT